MLTNQLNKSQKLFYDSNSDMSLKLILSGQTFYSKNFRFHVFSTIFALI